MKHMPLTIENRWDILYRDFPEIYDEFAAVPKQPSLLQVLMNRFDFRGKVVADIGSGSGSSSFELARLAKKVIRVEIEDAMRELAAHACMRRGLHNVEFVKGDAKKIPLNDHSVDIVTRITLALYPVEEYRQFVNEALRVAVNGGCIVMINITPGWYGGELSNIIAVVDTIETKQNEIFRCGWGEATAALLLPGILLALLCGFLFLVLVRLAGPYFNEIFQQMPALQ